MNSVSSPVNSSVMFHLHRAEFGEMHLSGIAQAKLVMTFPNFSQRKETTCLAMPLVMNICKVGCKHKPWNSTYLFTLVCSGLIHALAKT